MTDHLIAHNLTQIRQQLATCSAPVPIKLIAVSKNFAENAIVAAYQAKQLSFGENYAQELARKAQALADLKLDWHFIGAIQSNKAKLIANYASWVHSLTQLSHARRLNQLRPSQLPPLNVLIEVKINNDPSKHGLANFSEIYQLACAIQNLPNLRLQGLMGMASESSDQELIKSQFRQLATYRDQLTSHGIITQELSMGMSHDFHLAIECGATMVRIGRSIFGERNYAN